MGDLSRLLAQAPEVMGGKDSDAKNTLAQKVFASLNRITDKQISDTVAALSPEPGDILLKYVYRGLEEYSENNASLFKWQAALLEKFGIGSIIRVLSDRKTV